MSSTLALARSNAVGCRWRLGLSSHLPTRREELGAPMASELGKRYVCTTCGQQVICLQSGSGLLTCCGKPMQQTEPRRLPSGD